MSAHRHVRRVAFVTWMLIWFGAILAVNQRPALSAAGAVTWGAAILLQFGVAARRLIRHPQGV